MIAAFASVGIPLLVGRLDRRVLLAALLAVMALASTISALAPNFAVLIGSRLMVGITIGGFWAVAGSLAMRLVPGPYVARAMVLIFGGVGAAAVLGVPIGAILGEALGWRAAFGALAGLSAVVLVAALVFLPRLPAAEPVRVPSLLAQLREPALVAGVVATALLVAGHYGAYTFVSSALLDISGVGSGIIGPLLPGYGVLGMVANVVAGPQAARHPTADLGDDRGPGQCRGSHRGVLLRVQPGHLGGRGRRRAGGRCAGPAERPVARRGAGAARAADGAPGAGVRPLNATIAIGRMGGGGAEGTPYRTRRRPRFAVKPPLTWAFARGADDGNRTRVFSLGS